MDEGDDFFDDGEFDDIPDNTLLELEQNAITSTQGHQVARPPPTQSYRRQIHNATSLNRSQKSASNLPWRPPQRQQPPARPGAQGQSRPAAAAPHPSSSDYGFDEENVIDLDEPSMVVHPASGPSSRTNTRQVPRPVSGYGAKADLDDETAAAFAAADAELGAHTSRQWAQAPHLQAERGADPDVEALQVRIAELEAEKNRLRRSEQEARNATLAKQGEIAIVRTNQEKTAREYERRIGVMQKLHSDEASKQKAELESIRKEREKMETDNRFLQHDLAQEAERAKRLNGPSKPRVAKEKDTPRKTKRHGLGDGFEDDEVHVASPSRSRDRPRDLTPKTGLKRKRSALDSPLPALSFTQPAQPVTKDLPDRTMADSRGAVASSVDRAKHELIQRMLNHRHSERPERTIELFTKYALPTAPARSLSTIFLDGLMYMSQTDTRSAPALQVCRILTRMWTSCLSEEYHESISLILDMFQAAIEFEPAKTVSQLVEQPEALDVVLRTISLLAEPLVRAYQRSLKSIALAKAPEAQESPPRTSPILYLDDVINLLLNICQSANLSHARLDTFWRTISFKVALLTLHKALPISSLTSALQMLATSAFDTTFGPVVEDVAKQAQIESHFVDRLIVLLFEHPKAPSDEIPYSIAEINGLRLESLKVFKAICLTDHGGYLLAHHRTAIGRLVRFLDAQILQLYTVSPDVGMIRESTDEPTAHDVIIQTVNMTVRILHYLLRTFDSSIDLNQKLSSTAGGYHKFLVSMTRIAFSEQLVCEAGIGAETMEAAHDILDGFLSPEEGEAIAQAVETPRGTRSTTTRKDPTSGESQDTEMEDDADAGG